MTLSSHQDYTRSTTVALAGDCRADPPAQLKLLIVTEHNVLRVHGSPSVWLTKEAQLKWDNLFLRQNTSAINSPNGIVL